MSLPWRFVILAVTTVIVALTQLPFQKNLFLFAVGLEESLRLPDTRCARRRKRRRLAGSGARFRHAWPALRLEPKFLERATAIGWSGFVLGAAVVHIRQNRIGQPFVPGNAGAVF